MADDNSTQQTPAVTPAADPTAVRTPPATPPPAGLLSHLASYLGIDPDAVQTAAKAFYEHPVQAAEEVGSQVIPSAVASAKASAKGIVADVTDPEKRLGIVTGMVQPGESFGPEGGAVDSEFESAARRVAEKLHEHFKKTTGSGMPDAESTFRAPKPTPAAPEPDIPPEVLVQSREHGFALQKLGYSNQFISNINVDELNDILKNKIPAADWKPSPERESFWNKALGKEEPETPQGPGAKKAVPATTKPHITLDEAGAAEVAPPPPDAETSVRVADLKRMVDSPNSIESKNAQALLKESYGIDAKPGIGATVSPEEASRPLDTSNLGQGMSETERAMRIEDLQQLAKSTNPREASAAQKILQIHYGVGEDGEPTGEAGAIEPQFKNALASRNQMPDQTVNLSPAGSTYVGHQLEARNAMTGRIQNAYTDAVGTTTGSDLLPIPKRLLDPGQTPEATIAHEIGHALELDRLGEKWGTGIEDHPLEIMSHLHPEAGATAAVTVPWDKVPGTTLKSNGNYEFTGSALKNAVPDLLRLYASGSVFANLTHGSPVNAGTTGDFEEATRLVRSAGFTEDEAKDMLAATQKELHQQWNNPDILNLIRGAAAGREEGLSKTLHMSAERLQNIRNRVRQIRQEAQNGQETSNTPASAGAGSAISATTGQPGGAGLSTEGNLREGNGEAVSPVAESKVTPQRWFHGTSAEKSSLVQKAGKLVPGQESQYGIDVPRKDAVYVTSEPEIAKFYAGPKGTVHEVQVDPSKFIPDEDSVIEALNHGRELEGGGKHPGIGDAKVARRVQQFWLKDFNENAKAEGLPTADNFSHAWEELYQPSEGGAFEGPSQLAEDMKDVAEKIAKKDPQLAKDLIRVTGKAAHLGEVPLAKTISPSQTVKTAPATEYHPDLQKVIDQHRLTGAPPNIGFIAPDGKFVDLGSEEHPAAIARATGATYARDAVEDKLSGQPATVSDNRINFIDQTGAARIRFRTGRGGNEVVISVPSKGVTPEQIPAIQQAIAKVGRNGNLVMERADVSPETKDRLTMTKEFPRAADTEKYLKQIEAYPGAGTVSVRPNLETKPTTSRDFIPASVEQYASALKNNSQAATLSKIHPDAKIYQMREGGVPVPVFYAMNPDGEMAGAVNNSGGEVKDATTAIFSDAARHEGKYLTAWDVNDKLPSLYRKQGFEITQHMPYDADLYGVPSAELREAWLKSGWDGQKPYPSVVRMEPANAENWSQIASERAITNPAGALDPRTGKTDAAGIGTEIYPEMRQPINHAPTSADFQKFYEQHKAIFDKNPELRVGWDNESSAPGGHEINIGAVGPGAVKVAGRLDQRNAYDIAKGKNIDAGGTGKQTQFPDYPLEDRLKDLRTEPESFEPGKVLQSKSEQGSLPLSASDAANRKALAAQYPKGSTPALQKYPLNIEATGETGRATLLDFAGAMNKWAQQGLKPNKEIAAAMDRAQAELKYQLANDNSGLSWYKKDTSDAIATLKANGFPELENPTKNQAFRTLWGITSYGVDPDVNMTSAGEAWKQYQKTGKIPLKANSTTNWPGYSGIQGSITLLNKLLDEKGEQGAMDWLYSKHPVSEIREQKMKTHGTAGVPGKADEEKYGAFIFGPKAGAYTLNLQGVSDHTTVDVWGARMIRRWTGTLTPDSMDKPVTPEEARNFHNIVDSMGKDLGLDNSTVQAVLWQYEHDLYAAHGVGEAAKSYKGAAEKYVQKQREGTTGDFLREQSGLFAERLGKARDEAEKAGENAPVAGSAGGASQSGQEPPEVSEAAEPETGDTSFDFGANVKAQKLKRGISGLGKK